MQTSDEHSIIRREGIIPQWIASNAGISHGAVRLFAVMSGIQRSMTDGPEAIWPSHARIAEILPGQGGGLEVTPRTLKRWMTELQESGAITRHDCFDRDGTRKPNSYTLHYTPRGQ